MLLLSHSIMVFIVVLYCMRVYFLSIYDSEKNPKEMHEEEFVIMSGQSQRWSEI